MLRQPALTYASGPDEIQVVAARRITSSARFADDWPATSASREVDHHRRGVRGPAGRRAMADLRPAETEHLGEAVRRAHVDFIDQRGFGRIPRWHHHAPDASGPSGTPCLRM